MLWGAFHEFSGIKSGHSVKELNLETIFQDDAKDHSPPRRDFNRFIWASTGESNS